MVQIPQCSSPKGPLYCTDKNCPALGKDGNHIVMIQSEDLGKGLQERLAKKQPTSSLPLRPTSTPTATPSPSRTNPSLFDIPEVWLNGSISFYADSIGMDSVFYAEPNEEPIVARIEGGRKRDVYIIAKGTLRVEYGQHVIRTSSKLISIGINTDKKLERAINKGLIQVVQQPKFEAVDIRYMGRKDESRTPLGIASTNLATVIFESFKYLVTD